MPGLPSESASSYLQARLETLRRSQNPDGGWGYFSGKASWLEPTAYAALALHGEPAADHAWALLRSWQLPDGSWPPSAGVKTSSWGTSLCVTVAMARNEWDAPLQKGIAWLVGSSGVETNWLSVLVSRIGLVDYGRDVGLKSWPWKPGNSGWVEPTVHAIVALKVALKKASAKVSGPAKFPDHDLRERIRIGEAELLDVRGRDGGWNYGSPVVLGVDLPSYPETTALALIALQDHVALPGHDAARGHSDLGKAFDLALRQIGETPSPLARAWLTIAMRLHGMDAKAPDLNLERPGPPPPDLVITAVEALAAPGGNHRFMKTTALSGGTA